jgi:NitT/TauT family transport system substrate-binding protein
MLVGALALLAAPVAAGGASTPTSGTGPSLEKVDVAVLPVEPTAQAFYAKDMGFFRRQGIDANVTVLSDPAQIVAAVLSGNAQFSSLSVGGLATLKSRDAPVRLVASGALYRPAAPTVALVAGPGQRITRARDLIGRRIGIDQPNTIAHIGLLKWLKRGGVSADDVTFTSVPFALMLGPLARGTIDAAVLPEPFLTLATQRGAKRIATIFDSVCAKACLITAWMARKDMPPNLAARFRNAIQAAAVWANKKKNRSASGQILAKYTGIGRAVIKKTTRTSYSTRLRPAQAQPWIDVYAEFKVIPKTFSALDLVK